MANKKIKLLNEVVRLDLKRQPQVDAKPYSMRVMGGNIELLVGGGEYVVTNLEDPIGTTDCDEPFARAFFWLMGPYMNSLYRKAQKNLAKKKAKRSMAFNA